MRKLLLACAVIALSGCILPPVNRAPDIPLETAQSVDVTRYVGLWYEIARYPNFFERDCEGVTAEYAVRADGRIDVVNTCRKGAPDGPVESAEGVARIVDPQTNAKLKVRFGGPFEGDYWVLDRAEDYTWALVGEPRGRFLWILAREPTIDDALRADLLARLSARGYDVSQLYWPRQPPT